MMGEVLELIFSRLNFVVEINKFLFESIIVVIDKVS